MEGFSSKKNIKDIVEENKSISEFMENVEKVQQDEINSDRFIEVLKCKQKYDNRKFKDVESNLFTLISGLSDIENMDITNAGRKRKYVKNLKKIKKLYEDLTSNQIESNLFLSTTESILKSSKKDCKKIVELLLQRYEELEDTSIQKKIDIEFNISYEVLNYLKKPIKLQISVPSYNKIHSHEYVDIVDEKNMEYYKMYNQCVNIMESICSRIYIARIWKYIPDELIDKIYLSKFSIDNNDQEQDFYLRFYIIKNKVKRKSR